MVVTASKGKEGNRIGNENAGKKNEWVLLVKKKGKRLIAHFTLARANSITGIFRAISHNRRNSWSIYDTFVCNVCLRVLIHVGNPRA